MSQTPHSVQQQILWVLPSSVPVSPTRPAPAYSQPPPPLAWLTWSPCSTPAPFFPAIYSQHSNPWLPLKNQVKSHRSTAVPSTQGGVWPVRPPVVWVPGTTLAAQPSTLTAGPPVFFGCPLHARHSGSWHLQALPLPGMFFPRCSHGGRLASLTSLRSWLLMEAFPDLPTQGSDCPPQLAPPPLPSLWHAPPRTSAHAESVCGAILDTKRWQLRTRRTLSAPLTVYDRAWNVAISQLDLLHD